MSAERRYTVVAIERCRAEGRRNSLGFRSVSIFEKIRAAGGCPRNRTRWLAEVTLGAGLVEIDKEIASRLPACNLCQLAALYYDVLNQSIAPDGSDNNLPQLP